MAYLTRFATRFRVPIVLFWIVAAALLFVFAPKLSEVGVTDQAQFLPQGTESSTAASLVEEKFAEVTPEPAGEAELVIYNPDGLSAADMQNAKDLHDWLLSASGPQYIEGVISIFENEALRPIMVSTDNTAMVMKVDLSVGGLSADAKVVTDEVRSHTRDSYPDSTIYFTGETGLHQDLFESVQQTVDRTTFVTIALVAILLLVIYRSPVAMLLPLAAIGCSFLVGLGLIGFLGEAGVKFSTLTSAYLVVIVFGVGTDYCLFMVSRFREELRNKDFAEAQIEAIGRIAPVIGASALTVIVALLALGISRLGINQTSGYALAIGVAVTLAAALTLVPALMSLLGKHLFWPIKVKAPAPKERRFGWRVIGEWVSARPLAMAIPIVILLLVPYAGLPGLKTSVDIIDQLPQGMDSVKGYRTLSEHFDMGELWPSYALIEVQQGDMISAGSEQLVSDLAQRVAATDGVSGVTYSASAVPQVSGLAAQLSALAQALGTGSGLDQLGSLETVGQLLQGLPMQYPGIVQSSNFLQAAGSLAQASAVAAQIPAAAPASIPALMGQLQAAVSATSGYLNGLAAEFRLETNTAFSAYLMASYYSTDRTIARMDIVVSGDNTKTETLDAIGRVRASLREGIKASGLEGVSYYVGGDTAQREDIMLTNESDFGKVMALSVGGILLVIMILLRSILAPIYMVMTVLLSYGCTLGIATWIFLKGFHQNSLIYIVPLFVFVILVALGADYNIFLVSRIREEAEKRPMKEAVSEAVANTGGIITACGIILAGTFATLMTSPLFVAVEVGGAIAIGVTIDTFLVRAIVVPALARVFGRRSWWPSALCRKEQCK